MLIGSITETIVRNRLNQTFTPYGVNKPLIAQITQLVEEYPDDLEKAQENATAVRSILWNHYSGGTLPTQVTRFIYKDVNRLHELNPDWK